MANITAVVPVDSSCTTSGGFRPSSLGRGPRCSSRHSSSPSWTTLVPLDPGQPSPECWTSRLKPSFQPSQAWIQFKTLVLDYRAITGTSSCLQAIVNPTFQHNNCAHLNYCCPALYCHVNKSKKIYMAII